MGEADSRQAGALDFLGRPGSYEPPPATVERIETHASVVFLAGTFASVSYTHLTLPTTPYV